MIGDKVLSIMVNGPTGTHILASGHMSANVPVTQGIIHALLTDQDRALVKQNKFMVVTSIVTSYKDWVYADRERPTEVVNIFNTRGCLVIRGHGMTFVSDDNKPYQIEPRDVAHLARSVLEPLGITLHQNTRLSFEAEATVFDQRAQIRHIEHDSPKDT